MLVKALSKRIANERSAFKHDLSSTFALNCHIRALIYVILVCFRFLYIFVLLKHFNDFANTKCKSRKLPIYNPSIFLVTAALRSIFI